MIDLILGVLLGVVAILMFCIVNLCLIVIVLFLILYILDSPRLESWYDRW